MPCMLRADSNLLRGRSDHHPAEPGWALAVRLPAYSGRSALRGVLPARRCLRSQIFLASSWYVYEVRQRKILSTSDGVEDALSSPSLRSCDRSDARRSLTRAVFRVAVRRGGDSD